MVKNDTWILNQCEENGMISPFHREMIREVNEDGFLHKIVSKGLGSYGYDLTLSPKEFYVANMVGGNEIADVKKTENKIFKKVTLCEVSSTNRYFIIPPKTVGFGVVNEFINMPNNVMGFGFGKSTYSRLGINVNMPPFEPGWQGYPTIQITNHLHCRAKVYVDQGICQLVFLEGEQCEITYADRGGKYQNESGVQNVIFSKM